AMNKLFDRLVEQSQRAQDAVQVHLSDLAQAGVQAEALGTALRVNLQDNVAAIRDSAAESSNTARDIGAMLGQRAGELANAIEGQGRSLGEALTRHHEAMAELLRQQNEVLLRDLAGGSGEVMRQIRHESEGVSGALGEIHRQSEALREALRSQS